MPRGARPNPGHPITGQAVPRGSGPYHNPGPYYYYYPYNPYYFYGYGAFGLGYLYYDPFWWGYGGYGYPGYYGYGYPGYGYGYGYGDYYGYGGYSGYESGQAPHARGGLKLKIKPSDAEVYVDGYYMGLVDDFDGVFQHLDLEVGNHRVEIRAKGYQTLTFEVRIEPRDTITYRGELQPLVK